jgi:sarcosine oxidase delta subunit
MSTEKMVQYNSRFERLIDECLSEVANELRTARTQKQKNAILKKYGFDLKEFNQYVIKRTNDMMVANEVSAHYQKAADFLNIGRATVHRNSK